MNLHAARAAAITLIVGTMTLPAARLFAATMPPLKRPAGFVAPKPDEVVRLWPGDAPNLVAGGKAETYLNGRYYNVSAPELLVYLPHAQKAAGTALIICPGGGYGHLQMGMHLENVVKMLHDRGIVVLGLKYRTHYGKNDFVEDALADGKRAVRIVRSRAKQWGIDPARIGVQGYSAGGNLCLNLASHFDPGDPHAADPIERFSSRADFVALMCPAPCNREVSEFPLSKTTPPTFIASAEDDKSAPHAFAVAIDEKLTALGVPNKTFFVNTGGHGAFHYGIVEGPGGRWNEVLWPWLTEIGMLK